MALLAPVSRASAIQAGPVLGLAAALRERTHALHVQAERSGIVREMLRGQASREGYALLLRNLLPAYAEMENALERHRLAPALRDLAQPAVYRAWALASDLEDLSGPDWASALPLLPAGERYARQVGAAAQGSGTRLIAHAYARYMGDLYGGQILRRILARAPGLGPRSLGFYDFPAIADAEGFKAAYRQSLDRAALGIEDREAVIEEAAIAFELNIEVSLAVQERAGRRDAS